MKLILSTFALISLALADVSHLSRQYLPAAQDYAVFASGESNEHDSSSAGLLEVNYETDTNAKFSDADTYSSQEYNLEYAQQAEEVPQSEGEQFTYVKVEKQAYEPVAPAVEHAVSYATYNKLAAADDDSLSYGQYSNDKTHIEYQIEDTDADQHQQHVAASLSGVAFGHAGALDEAAGISYGHYDLVSQDTGAHDLGLSSYKSSYDHSGAAFAASPTEGQSAWHGIVSYPAQTHNVVAQYVSSGSASRFKTKNDANGGYIY